MSIIELPGLRLPLDEPPASWSVSGSTLMVEAAARTDIFRGPFAGWAPKNDAARALTEPPAGGEWQFQARVRVKFAASWDAGAVLLWADDHHWAKLNFELAPDGQPSVFSVVTRDGRSDDAVGWPVAADALWLRISAFDGGYTLHTSEDGRVWRLARQFGLDAPGPVRVGVEAQSPVGEGCTVTFDGVALTPARLANPFDGS
jgi:regulation of enolase protein 1 (concanavalin A-like superfamily)